MIDRPPKIVLNVIDFHENHVEMPLPLSVLAQVGGSLRSDLAGENWTETADPEPDAFMANIDSAFVQEVFHTAQ